MTSDEIKLFIKSEIQRVMTEEFYEVVNSTELNDVNDTLLMERLNYNLSDVYHITHELPTSIEFKDEFGVTHITKITKNNDFMEVKLYWLDDTNTLRLDAPTKTTNKTLNTHLSNLINKFLPKYKYFVIQPTDAIRHRLFWLVLNKYVDTTKWDITQLQRKILIIKKPTT